MVIVDDDTTYTNDLISLDNIDQSQFHAFGIGLKYQIANIAGSDVYITGDLGIAKYTRYWYFISKFIPWK